MLRHTCPLQPEEERSLILVIPVSLSHLLSLALCLAWSVFLTVFAPGQHVSLCMSWLRDLVFVFVFFNPLSVAIQALSESDGAEVLKLKCTMEFLFYLFLYPFLSLLWRISQGRLPVCGITIVIPTSWHLDFISSLLEAVQSLHTADLSGLTLFVSWCMSDVYVVTAAHDK